ncbi:MAG: hypothetical protein M1409_02970 [Actinobacteria bacterium]|nr:hypothetical protein [Actinomycetota bacterium]
MIKNLNPRIGFCLIQNKFEVGADNSKKIYDKIIEEFLKYENIDFLPFNEFVDNSVSANMAGEFFYEKKIDLLLCIESTWSNDDHVIDILEYTNTPLILWAMPGMQTGSLCGFHQLGVVLHELGRKHEIFYGDVGDVNIQKKVISLAKAAGLKNYLRKSKFGLIGYRVPGMTEVTFDEFELKRKFGPRIMHFGINDIVNGIKDINELEAKKIWLEIKNSGIKINVGDKEGLISSKNYLLLKKIALENNLDGFAIECYPEIMGQVCLAASLLARENIVIGCEGDMNSTTGMLILNYLTGVSVHNTDLLDPDSENSIVFSHCGSGDFSLSKNIKEIDLCHVRLQHCGVCVKFLPKLGNVTLLNIVGRRDTYRISALEAYSQKTEMVFPGNPLSARFNISVEKFLNIVSKNAVGHHWMIGYGSVLEELKYFADLIDVKFIEFV